MLSDERREVSDGKLRTLSLKSLRSRQKKTPDTFSVPPALLRVAARNPRAVAEALHREPRKGAA